MFRGPFLSGHGVYISCNYPGGPHGRTYSYLLYIMRSNESALLSAGKLCTSILMPEFRLLSLGVFAPPPKSDMFDQWQIWQLNLRWRNARWTGVDALRCDQCNGMTFWSCKPLKFGIVSIFCVN